MIYQTCTPETQKEVDKFLEDLSKEKEYKTEVGYDYFEIARDYVTEFLIRKEMCEKKDKELYEMKNLLEEKYNKIKELEVEILNKDRDNELLMKRNCELTQKYYRNISAVQIIKLAADEFLDGRK